LRYLLFKISKKEFGLKIQCRLRQTYLFGTSVSVFLRKRTGRKAVHAKQFYRISRITIRLSGSGNRVRQFIQIGSNNKYWNTQQLQPVGRGVRHDVSRLPHDIVFSHVRFIAARKERTGKVGKPSLSVTTGKIWHNNLDSSQDALNTVKQKNEQFSPVRPTIALKAW
jgi:hypothetical protein